MPPLQSLSRPSIQELTSYLLFPCAPKRLSLSRRCLHLSPPPLFPRNPPQPAAQHQHSHQRPLSSSASAFSSPLKVGSPSPTATPSTKPPTTTYRGPPSSETTQTDFSSLDVLGATPAPSTSVDACVWDGFHLNSGLKVVGDGGAVGGEVGVGVLLVAGEAFRWCPWRGGDGEKSEGDGKELRLVNKKGQWEVDDGVWGVLELVWPKPDLLILGLGKEMRPLSEQTRRKINSLGIRVDIQDTRNAAAQFNLLATERGVSSVAAALIPIGWKEGVGVV